MVFGEDVIRGFILPVDFKRVYTLSFFCSWKCLLKHLITGVVLEYFRVNMSFILPDVPSTLPKVKSDVVTTKEPDKLTKSSYMILSVLIRP